MKCLQSRVESVRLPVKLLPISTLSNLYELLFSYQDEKSLVFLQVRSLVILNEFLLLSNNI